MRSSVPLLLALALTRPAAAAPPAPTPRPAAAEEEKQISLVREAIQDGNLEEATARGEKALAAFPRSARLKQWVGRAYAAQAFAASGPPAILRAHRAQVLLEEAVALDPANLDARFDLLGTYFRPQGIGGTNPAMAASQVDEIARIDAGRGHVARGMLREFENRLDAAGEEYRLGFAAHPGSTRALAGVVDFEARAGRFEAALDACRKALKASDDPLPWYLMGKLALQSGKDAEKGLGYFDAFLARKPAPEGPSWADAHWRKGLLLERLGRRTEARAAYEAARRLQPGHPEATRELARLAGATPTP